MSAPRISTLYLFLVYFITITSPLLFTINTPHITYKESTLVGSEMFFTDFILTSRHRYKELQSGIFPSVHSRRHGMNIHKKGKMSLCPPRVYHCSSIALENSLMGIIQYITFWCFAAINPLATNKKKLNKSAF